MKKYFPILIFLVVASLSFTFDGCKKNDDGQVGQPPADSFRLVKQELIAYYDTANVVVDFYFNEDSIDGYDYTVDGELHTKTGYFYPPDADEKIIRIDTSYNLYDTVETFSIEYLVQNNLIIRSVFENDIVSRVEYTYQGDKLTKWEMFNNYDKPVVKGEYEYQGEKLVSYSYYIHENEGSWHLSSKTEYTYKEGKRHEILYYIRFDESNDSDLIMKRQYHYEGEQAKTIDLYFRTLEDVWEIRSVSYLYYDSNGNLTGVKDYATDGTTEIIEHELMYTWEQGESNIGIFYKIQPQTPLSDLGYPIWGFQSASNAEKQLNDLSKYYH